MDYQIARLLEVVRVGNSVAGILDLPEKYHPKPGQYLPCQSLTNEADIPYHPLFSVFSPAGQNFLGPLPPRWQVGDQIACLLPQGKGFNLPKSARRVALLALAGQPIQTLPLIEPALKQNAAVAVFFQEHPNPDILTWLPSSVEVSPISALQENLDWPDYMAMALPRDRLDVLSSLFGQGLPGISGQVLVITEMPCRGMGECGVCAVKTRHSWRLACADGPVFPLKELLHVAG